MPVIVIFNNIMAKIKSLVDLRLIIHFYSILDKMTYLHNRQNDSTILQVLQRERKKIKACQR